jgi:translation elongation factor EF-1alpha
MLPADNISLMEGEKAVGKVTHYFNRVGVAVIELSDHLRIGEKILIEGGTTRFEQVVDSMQIEHETITEAQPGDSIGLKVLEKVREGDSVYRKT